MSKLANGAVFDRCGKCIHKIKVVDTNAVLEHYWHCPFLGKIVNPDTIDKDCPLPTCFVLEAKYGRAPLNRILANWDDIEKIIIVRKPGR